MGFLPRVFIVLIGDLLGLGTRGIRNDGRGFGRPVRCETRLSAPIRAPRTGRSELLTVPPWAAAGTVGWFSRNGRVMARVERCPEKLGNVAPPLVHNRGPRSVKTHIDAAYSADGLQCGRDPLPAPVASHPRDEQDGSLQHLSWHHAPALGLPNPASARPPGSPTIRCRCR